MNMQKNNKKFLSACGIATLVVSTAVVPTTGVKAASTERLAGSDRYETAVEVSEKGWTSSDYVVLANGESYADALCAVPLAKAKDAPILLTETNSLNSETLAEMKRLNAKHVIIVGGDGVVTEGVQNAIKSQVTSDVERYGGADRFETSVKIAKALGSPSEVFVANGLNFPDALSAAPIAAIEGDPIILTRSTELPQVSADYIESNSNITKSYVVGGSGVISDSILNKLPNPERLGGADRYETNEAIVEAFESSLNFNEVFVARGDEFSDSLTGAALAAKEKSALVITATSGSVSPYTKELFEDLVDSGVTIEALGGSAVLPDSIISELESAITKSSTSGGGGGSSSSSSSSSATDETDDIIDDFGEDTIESKINDSKLGKYFTANVTDDSITLTINDEYKYKLATPKEIFENVNNNKNITKDRIKDNLDAAYEIAKNHVDSITTGTGKTFKDVLKQIKDNNELRDYTKYIKNDSDDYTIDTDALAESIWNKTLTKDDYDTFVDELETKITEEITDKDTSPTIEYGVMEFDKVTKDGDVVYNANKSRSYNIEKAFDVSSVTGTYKLYYDDYEKYVVVTVKI
jgi:putative cell wall-binding protein